MKKIVTMFVILSLLVSVFTPITAYASTTTPAVQSLTYAERIAKLKTDYNVIYSFDSAEFAKLPELFPTLTQEEKNFAMNESLKGVETALSRIGSNTFKTFTSKYGTYSISFKDFSGGYGYQEPGRVAVNIDLIYHYRDTERMINNNSEDMKSLWLQDISNTSLSNFVATIVLHELGHEYDYGYTKLALSSELKKFRSDNKIYDNVFETDIKVTEYVSITRDPHLLSGSILIGRRQFKDIEEDFAWLFAWMLLQDKTITNYRYYSGGENFYSISKNDVIYGACDIILKQMIKDFGTESTAVKRAAWFLEQELPAK